MTAASDVPGLDVPWPFTVPPVRVWQRGGWYCAIAMGLCSLNGYVRVPDGSVLRKYENAHDIDADVHGGLTWGPVNHPPFTIPPSPEFGGKEKTFPGIVRTWEECKGWVGFDTGHSSDYWDVDDLPWPPDVEEQRITYAKQFYDISRRSPHAINWTIQKVIEETEWLCSQLQAAEYALIEGTTDGTDLGSAVQEEPSRSVAEDSG